MIGDTTETFRLWGETCPVVLKVQMKTIFAGIVVLPEKELVTFGE